MGGIENFGDMADYISKEHKIYALDLKLFEGSLLKVSVKRLSEFFLNFMNHINLKKLLFLVHLWEDILL